MASRRKPITYLPTTKQMEDESLKVYLTHFNKECMISNDQDEKITLVALLGEICSRIHGGASKEDLNHIVSVHGLSRRFFQR